MKKNDFEKALSRLCEKDPVKFLKDWKEGKINVAKKEVSLDVYNEMQKLSLSAE